MAQLASGLKMVKSNTQSSEITIAGNLKDMFKAVVGLGGDIERRGGIQTGSVLIEQMQVAGS